MVHLNQKMVVNIQTAVIPLLCIVPLTYLYNKQEAGSSLVSKTLIRLRLELDDKVMRDEVNLFPINPLGAMSFDFK